jgi:hypothetical protein
MHVMMELLHKRNGRKKRKKNYIKHIFGAFLKARKVPKHRVEKIPS